MIIHGKNINKKNKKKLKINKHYYFAKYLLKYLSLLIFSIFTYIIHHPVTSKITFETGKKFIFSFYEPKHKMPGYLWLCIQTWKKFLPEYDIKILNYNSLNYYIDESVLSKIIYKKMPKALQADAIRVALLKKYGGIWMDTDTIILNREFLKELNNSNLVMFGDIINKTQHISFIYSNNSNFVSIWFAKIIENINYYKQFFILKHNYTVNNIKNSYQKLKSGTYLGNGIIDPLLRNITDPKQYSRLDKYKMGALPEIIYFGNSSLDKMERYKHFYFTKGDSKQFNYRGKGVIILHNSWTPKRYKKMTAKRFLDQNIFLSKLLSQILNISNLRK